MSYLYRLFCLRFIFLILVVYSWFQCIHIITSQLLPKPTFYYFLHHVLLFMFWQLLISYLIFIWLFNVYILIPLPLKCPNDLINSVMIENLAYSITITLISAQSKYGSIPKIWDPIIRSILPINLECINRPAYHTI